MKGHVALVREQGVNFAVVVVRPSVMSGPKSERDDLVQAFSVEFGLPAVLMVQNSRGTPTYYGRPDLVTFYRTSSSSSFRGESSPCEPPRVAA